MATNSRMLSMLIGEDLNFVSRRYESIIVESYNRAVVNGFLEFGALDLLNCVIVELFNRRISSIIFLTKMV